MDSLSEFQVDSSGNEWAKGCAQCNYGLIAAPEPIGALPLSEQRAVQADEDMLLFCDCRAGFMYRQYLRKVHSSLNSYSRQKIYEIVSAASVPTIHMEPQP